MKTNQPLKFSKVPALTAGVFALAAMLMLTACGTTSSLQDRHGKSLTSTRTFTKVTVQDFKNATPEVGEKINTGKVYFADRIATELKKRGQFLSVARNAKPDANTVVISGTITKYDEGNPNKRLWIGMGFGMALLEANVEFRDSKGLTIGMIKVDKNSWPLGGGLAASQDPQGFMKGAAEKVAEEAGKLTRSAVKPSPPPAKATPTPVKKTPPAPAKKTPTPQPRTSNSGR
jgi:Domain of unknown function (DUF4410)